MSSTMHGEITGEGTVEISISSITPIIDSTLSGVGTIGGSISPSGGNISVSIGSIDSSGATADASDILRNRTAVGKSGWIYGTMPENDDQVSYINDINDRIDILEGHHNGNGFVEISNTEKQKVISENIKKDVVLLGVKGEYDGKEIALQEKSIVPSFNEQVIEPDVNYDYLSKVTVKSIPYREVLNEYGTSILIG